MADPFIGRRDSIGVGLEVTPGTMVAPQVWERQLKLALDPKTTVAEDKSALGRIEDMSDSALTEQWAEGSLNGNLADLTIGYLLANLFGSNSAALHAGETTVYDTTYTVNSTSLPPYITFARSNPVFARRYAYGALSDIEIDATVGKYVTFTSTLMAKAGATSTETVSYVSQNKFTSKHVTTKVAADVASLSGATGLALKSLKLKITRGLSRFTPLGTIDPAAFDPEAFGVTGEIVLRFTDTTLDALGLANTAQAMSIDLLNSDVTIGTAANPELAFTLPQVRLKPMKLDDNLDQPLSQTFQFTGELSTTDGYMIQPVLTTTQNGFAHA